MQPRFKAINTIARSLRFPKGANPGDIKTNVKYGRFDFELWTKPRNGSWSRVNLDTGSLPQILPPGNSEPTSSPPVGRTRLPADSNKRGANSPLENENKTKLVKIL